eukprot:747187-Hanusia_phi.AAC.3
MQKGSGCGVKLFGLIGPAGSEMRITGRRRAFGVLKRCWTSERGEDVFRVKSRDRIFQIAGRRVAVVGEMHRNTQETMGLEDKDW